MCLKYRVLFTCLLMCTCLLNVSFILNMTPYSDLFSCSYSYSNCFPYIILKYSEMLVTLPIWVIIILFNSFNDVIFTGVQYLLFIFLYYCQIFECKCSYLLDIFFQIFVLSPSIFLTKIRKNTGRLKKIDFNIYM